MCVIYILETTRFPANFGSAGSTVKTVSRLFGDLGLIVAVKTVVNKTYETPAKVIPFPVKASKGRVA